MRPSVYGYTLIELLLVLAVVAVLTSMAVPGLGRVVQTNAGTALMNDLARMVSMARALAVHSGSNVTLCPSHDGSSCGGDWAAGMLLFTDANRDRKLDATDELARVAGALTVAGSLQLRSFPNRQYLQFTPQGTTHGQNGSFTWCPANAAPELAQQLIFSQSGRTRFARDNDGDGIREDSNGLPLPCA